MDQESSDRSGFQDELVLWARVGPFFSGHEGIHQRINAALMDCGTCCLVLDRHQSVIGSA